MGGCGQMLMFADMVDRPRWRRQNTIVGKKRKIKGKEIDKKNHIWLPNNNWINAKYPQMAF